MDMDLYGLKQMNVLLYGVVGLELVVQIKAVGVAERKEEQETTYH